MSTSAITLFGALTAQAQGKKLPHRVAHGYYGDWTRDAAEALSGAGCAALAPFGGHKGMGLSLVVELLAGALSGSAVLGQVSSKKEAQSWGHLFIAIRPEALTDNFAEKAASVIAAVKASGPEGMIRIPGERSAQMAQERLAAGVMPIPTKIWQSIVHTAKHGLVSSERDYSRDLF
jgi:hydroxycarboxylate dehydrogenase B